ncbi:MAG: DUF4175 family protein [Candidatus Zixiibacteriota bacterium]
MHELANIEKRLRGTILRNRLVLLLAGLTAVITVLLGIWLILSSITALTVLPVAVKLSLLGMGFASVLYALYRYLWAPLKNSGNLINTALGVEKKHPELKGRLVAALQFRDMNIDRTNFSRALIEMTGKQAAQLTSGINFNEIVSGYPFFRKLRSGVAMAALVFIAGFIAPGMFSNAFDVYSQPTTLIAPPPGFSIVADPGNAERVKHSDIDIGGALIGMSFPDHVVIYYKYADGRWQSQELGIKPERKFGVTSEAIFTDTVAFAMTLKQVRRSFDYYIEAGQLKTPTYAIDIVERPRVTDLRLAISYPDYSRLNDSYMDENNGSFAALVGSRIHLEIEANRDIATGAMMLADSTRIPLEVVGAKAAADFRVTEDFSYHIRITDAQGEQNPDPIEYYVSAIPDEYPVINVLSPGYDVNLDERMMIPFALNISDDFGFSSLVLKYQVISGGMKGSENVAVINFSPTITTEGEVTFNWDVDPFNLLPSDYILYHFELADNDVVSGPKVTSSRTYAARLPSIDEIVQETETIQEGRVFEAEKILKEQREMAEKLRQMAQDMQASEKSDWKQNKELQNLVDQQTQTAENLDKLAKEMEESIKQLEQNDLISEQIMQKLMELQKLFEEVATPEMKEAMKKLAEELQNMTPEEREKAMKDFQLSQEEMLKRLERSVALLKNMQIEQKMAAMLKMINEMLLEQNRVNVETMQSESDQDNPQLAQREQNLKKQMSALKKEAEKLDQLLAENEKRDTKKESEFSKAVKENTAGANMQNMADRLNENDQEGAINEGEQSSDKLSQLAQQMQEIIEELSDNQGQELANNMRSAIDDANYLSREQEDIYQRSNTNRNVRDELRQAAAEQQILKEAVNGLTSRVNEMAMQTPFLAAEVRSYLEKAQQLMQGSCNNLGQRRGTAAVNDQRDAIYNLNQAAVKLLDGLENQKQCNKGGSCNKPNQKMQSLCQKQSEINKQTQGQCNNPGNKRLSTSERQALQRLAGEQGAVRKSLEELQKEFGNRRDILGRLDALSDEMRDIEELLEDGNTGGDLLDKQLKVYSRMLDVQKSLNRRDYARERQAITAEDIFRTSPGALNDDNPNRTESLQDRLNRNLQGGYPKQYEQQIKAYFKAITGMGQESNGNEN